jgi:3-oxoacyl-[acyl-carrier-protein] synthase-1
MRTVHIVAVVAQTPVGLTAESSAAAVRARLSRVKEHPFLIDGAGQKLRCARCESVDAAILGADRLIALTRQSLQAMSRALRLRTPLRIPLWLALPEPRPGFSTAHAESVRQSVSKLVVPGISLLSVEEAGNGHAGVLCGMEQGVRALSEGRTELCLVGGVDSYFEAETLNWLDSERRIARDGIRSGFSPGEGACWLALADDRTRMQLGLPSLGIIRSIATATEKRSIDSEEGLLGEALTEVVNRAAADLADRSAQIDSVYCDINGERHRTDEWGFTLLRSGALFRDGTDYVTGVSEWGDMGAATAALSCLLATQAWQRGYATGPRGAMILEQGNA